MTAGARVRYTYDKLGMIGHPGEVNRGDLGTVLGPMDDYGWIATEPDGFAGYCCPVTLDMIEPAGEVS